MGHDVEGMDVDTVGRDGSHIGDRTGGILVDRGKASRVQSSEVEHWGQQAALAVLEAS